MSKNREHFDLILSNEVGVKISRPSFAQYTLRAASIGGHFLDVEKSEHYCWSFQSASIGRLID